MRTLLSFCILLFMYASTDAFVSKIDPTLNPRLPCHQMKFAVNLFVQGTFSAAQLKSTLATHYGLTFSAEDDTDFSNLGTLISGASTELDKDRIAEMVEGLCGLWEQEFTFIVNHATKTPKNAFRFYLGIAEQ